MPRGTRGEGSGKKRENPTNDQEQEIAREEVSVPNGVDGVA